MTSSFRTMANKPLIPPPKTERTQHVNDQKRITLAKTIQVKFTGDSEMWSFVRFILLVKYKPDR